MIQIEIDFDVFQKLTAMRECESVTLSDVIRGLLNMSVPTLPVKPQVHSAFQGLSDADVKVLADGGDLTARAELTRRGIDEERPATSETRRSDEPNAATSDMAREQGNWTAKGVTFPAGTEFRASYKGQTIYARVESGALWVNGKAFYSPSSAAVSVTGNPVNGWIFWECRLPGKSAWKILKSLRK